MLRACGRVNEYRTVMWAKHTVVDPALHDRQAYPILLTLLAQIKEAVPASKCPTFLKTPHAHWRSLWVSVGISFKKRGEPKVTAACSHGESPFGQPQFRNHLAVPRVLLSLKAAARGEADGLPQTTRTLQPLLM